LRANNDDPADDAGDDDQRLGDRSEHLRPEKWGFVTLSKDSWLAAVSQVYGESCDNAGRIGRKTARQRCNDYSTAQSSILSAMPTARRGHANVKTKNMALKAVAMDPRRAPIKSRAKTRRLHAQSVVKFARRCSKNKLNPTQLCKQRIFYHDSRLTRRDASV
jgi:hypothetical protein